MQRLDDFTRSYLETILWAETDESTESGGYPLDANYSLQDFAEESVETAIRECREFREANADDLFAVPTSPDGSSSDSYAGYLFWLTRCGYGAGFWDREEIPEPQRSRLTDAAHATGERSVYVGDDGKLYITTA